MLYGESERERHMAELHQFPRPRCHVPLVSRDELAEMLGQRPVCIGYLPMTRTHSPVRELEALNVWFRSRRMCQRALQGFGGLNEGFGVNSSGARTRKLQQQAGTVLSW